MLLTAGLVVLGAIAFLSMLMMIGNVLTKSPYGKTWAMLGGLSVLLAGGLVVLRVLVPSVDTLGTADAEVSKQEQESKKQADPEDTSATEAEDGSQDATATEQETTAAEPADGSSPLADLSVLNKIMDLLKEGKPLPPEYLALLPDGAPGVVAEQAKVQSSPISKPLQSQLVSLNRSQGTSYKPSNSYVPTTKPTTTTGGKVVVASNQPSQTPADSGSTQTTDSGTPQVPAPQHPPVTPQTPTTQPEPPASSPPPVATSAALLDGGLMKSVLGGQKSTVQSYFKYNQFLGQEGNTMRYLRGASIVEVTFSDSGVAQQVLLRFDRFTPQGKDMSYYEDYMRSVAGVTKAKESFRDDKNVYWNGVYPGASSLHFHIDTGSNYGYVKASY